MKCGIQVFCLMLVACLLAGCATMPREPETRWQDDLVFAIRRDEVKEVARILSEQAVSPGVALNENSLTPLMVAGRANSLEVTRWLLDHGAPVDAGTKLEDGTALVGACDSGYLEIVRLLVEHGAKVNRKDGRGWSPLLAAADQRHNDVAQFLMAQGADINAEFPNGRSVLMVAAETGDAALVQALLFKGVAVNHVAANGEDALIEAAAEDHAEVVALLLGKGAQINLQDQEGWTALAKAAALGHCQSVKVLCEAGADPGIRNNFGRAARDYAKGIEGISKFTREKDFTAAVERGLLHQEELYYVLARKEKESDRDYECVTRMLEVYGNRLQGKR
jgi:ankyrin repeat protein